MLYRNRSQVAAQLNRMVRLGRTSAFLSQGDDPLCPRLMTPAIIEIAPIDGECDFCDIEESCQRLVRSIRQLGSQENPFWPLLPVLGELLHAALHRRSMATFATTLAEISRKVLEAIAAVPGNKSRLFRLREAAQAVNEACSA